MQALQANAEFTLECLEAFIKELNCLSQGLLADTQLTQFDTSTDLASLRVLIQAITCFFTIAHMHNTASKEIVIRLYQALTDLLALQQNFKQSDELKQMRPFPSDDAAREFVLFHIKDPQYKATIQAMNCSSEKEIDKPTVSQTDSTALPKTFFFAPLTNSSDTILVSSSSASEPVIEEKLSQPSPFP